MTVSPDPIIVSLPDVTWTQAVGRALSVVAEPGDVFALVGDLGTGKSTLARDFIRARTSEDEDVPSPTFTLVQTYEQTAPPLWHMDAYRLTDVSEAQELGLEDAFEGAVCLIEWPDRVAEILPPAQTIWIKLTHAEDGRQLKLMPPPGQVARFQTLERDARYQAFLLGHERPVRALTAIAGDASGRQYLRTQSAEGAAILMDAATMPHVVAPFVAASNHLLSQGLSAPKTLARDVDLGLLLSEDLGPLTLRAAVVADPEPVYEAVVEALVTLQSAPPPPDWTQHVGPRTLADRLHEELGRFLTWYVPAAHGAEVAAVDADAFMSLWQDLLAPSLSGPQVFSVLDCIHDNLFWLPDRAGVARVGFIDIQDAVLAPPVYDLMSLLWDVRHPVPAPLRQRLIARFAAAVSLPSEEVERDMALWSVQRNLKILGTFVRLAQQEGKAGYMTHLPVVRQLITEQLAHPALAPVADWLARHASMTTPFDVTE